MLIDFPNQKFCAHIVKQLQCNLSGLLCHLKLVSLVIFCLDDLSIGVSELLKSRIIIVLLLISSFIAVSICLMY